MERTPEIILALAGFIGTITALLAWTVKTAVTANLKNSDFLQESLKAKHYQMERMEKERELSTEKFTRTIDDFNKHLIPTIKSIDHKADRIIKATNA